MWALLQGGGPDLFNRVSPTWAQACFRGWVVTSHRHVGEVTRDVAPALLCNGLPSSADVRRVLDCTPELDVVLSPGLGRPGRSRTEEGLNVPMPRHCGTSSIY